MALLELWRDEQRAMSALGRSLTEDQGALVVPACPAWTVKDVYAHMAGVADDLLAGRLDGVATDPWTQTQVDARRDLPLTAVLDEWDEKAPALIEALTPLGDAVDSRLLVDLWTHHQDVRGAVDLPGDRDSERSAWAAEGLRSFARSQFRRAGLDPVDLAFTGEEVGPSTAVVVDPFELARAGTGRRSPGQVAAWAWTVEDPSPYVPLVPVFTARTDDLEESA